jgi:hypothetical protein
VSEVAWNLKLDIHLPRHESAILSFEVLSADEEVSLLRDDQRCLCGSRRNRKDEEYGNPQDGVPDLQSFHRFLALMVCHPV